MKLLRAYKKVYNNKALTAKEIATAMGLETARNIIGVINNLVKNGYLEKGHTEGIKMNTYDLTEKAMKFKTQRFPKEKK